MPGRPPPVPASTKDLHLGLGGAALAPTPDAHAVSFPPGAGGLSTLRLECGYRAPFATALAGSSALTFSDGSWSERIGWREIVATADGTILDTHGLPATSPSAKLTAYPADMIAQPLDIRSASIAVRPDPAARPAATPPATALAPAPVARAPAAPARRIGPTRPRPRRGPCRAAWPPSSRRSSSRPISPRSSCWPRSPARSRSARGTP